jgi:hypothetical protein
MDDSGNIYGFSSNANTHLIKNSEWGAVAYLAKSQYGLGSTNIYKNNVTLNSGGTSTINPLSSAYAVTGYTAVTADSGGNIISSVTSLGDTIVGSGTSHAWYTTDGQKGSTTGDISGVYDMSGCVWERTTGYIANGNGNLSACGNSFATATTSTKYATVYPMNSTFDNTSIPINATNLDIASTNNYAADTTLYGDAVKETSTASAVAAGWYGDHSYYPGMERPFYGRGGAWGGGTVVGLFAFYRGLGYSSYTNGFRATLCP